MTFKAKLMPSPNYGAVWLYNPNGDQVATFPTEDDFAAVMGKGVDAYNMAALLAEVAATPSEDIRPIGELAVEDVGVVPVYSEAQVVRLLLAVIGPETTTRGGSILAVRWVESTDVSDVLPEVLVNKIMEA